jgi:hypothetical protein
VSAANIYKRADDKTIMVDDTSANTKHKSTLADNIAKLVNSALEVNGK